MLCQRIRGDLELGIITLPRPVIIQKDKIEKGVRESLAEVSQV